ncbi:MAG: tetratricopeptide repeat protein, partial [Terriglobales bacterium]
DDQSESSSSVPAQGQPQVEQQVENEKPQPATAVTQPQTTQDPAEQAVSGEQITAAGNSALEHYDLARYYFSHWQLGLAAVELEVTIMYAPTMKIAHRDYCLVSLFTGHPIRALAEASMVVGLGDPIPLNEQEQQDLVQRASKVHYRKALELARKSSWDSAISELQWADAYTPHKAAIQRSLAFCYASKGDFSKAEKVYETTFAIDPDDAFSHADYAYLLQEHGKSGNAEGQLSQALKIAPNVAALHVDLGWIAATKGDLNTAQTEYREAIKLQPQQPGLWLQLGHLLEKAGKKTEAKEAYNKVLALDPSEGEATQRLNALQSASSQIENVKPSMMKHQS